MLRPKQEDTKMSATICFISCNYFGFQALKGILASEEFKMKELTIPLIISLDQNKKYSTIGFYDFDKVAAQYKIENIRVDSIKSPEAVKIITTARPDYLFIVGWPELPPASILDIPKKINGSQIRNANTHGCIGMHPTLLSEGRDSEPILGITLKGLSEMGITALSF
jgi:methionyl-tRNA formyltransferase